MAAETIIPNEVTIGNNHAHTTATNAAMIPLLQQDHSMQVDPYLLGRSYFSSSRLNLSHFLWKQVLGFNIHPLVPTSGFKRIVDVATGTGIWPLDVASEYADCEVDGFDISLEQCPKKEFMPRIRKLGVWNVFEEPPEEMRGRYDMVHVRLVVFVVRDNDPRPLIANLMKLLKPGGWLQWDELDLSGSHLERASGNELEAPTASAALKRVQGVGVSHWASNLPEILEDEGFEKAQKDVYIIPPPWVKMFSDSHLMMEEEMSLRMPEGARQVKQREIAAISEESKQGTVISTPLMVTVARKPMAQT